MSSLDKDFFHFVFDVESIGLHGEGFALGWVLLNEKGIEIDYGLSACDSDTADGSDSDRTWVKRNVPSLEVSYPDPYTLRMYFSKFFNQLTRMGDSKLRVYAECPWPVEANFLSRCVEFHKLKAPYPLYDISSLMLARGVDPLQPYGRLGSELPMHNPLNDARQSARVLRELHLA